MFLSASVGFCALAAIIRAFRGEATVGNFFVDMWRVAIYIYVPVSLIFGVIFMQQGMPMTFASTEVATTLEPGSMGLDDKGQAKPQTIVVGPVAAVIPIKMLGTNGGGFYGMNAAHPLENPTATTNFFTTLAMMLFPFALVLMYGRMLGRIRHSVVIYGVMLVMMIGLIAWVIRTRHDGAEPRPDRARRDGLSDSSPPRRRTASSTCRARPSRPCRSTSISATSRARSCASAPRPARRSRRSPPTSPAARSTPRWTA